MIRLDNKGKYVIDSDEYCFMVKEYGGLDKKGEVVWKNVTYHANSKQVVSEIADRGLSLGINGDWTAMVDLINGCKNSFNELLALKK